MKLIFIIIADMKMIVNSIFNINITGKAAAARQQRIKKGTKSLSDIFVPFSIRCSVNWIQESFKSKGSVSATYPESPGKDEGRRAFDSGIGTEEAARQRRLCQRFGVHSLGSAGDVEC